MPSAAARYVRLIKLLQSRAPSAELAAAALAAQEAAGLEQADFIVIAVPPNTADGVVVELEERAAAAVDELDHATPAPAPAVQ